jgi:hypothetical protein
MSKKKGLFILHEGINSTIFNSQVLEHVSKMNDKDFDFEILSFNTEPELWKTSTENKEKLHYTNPGIKIHLIKSINIYYPFVFIFHVFQLIVFLRKNKVKYSFIHSRSDYTQFIVLISKYFHKLNSIWDCRGDSISELKFAISKNSIFHKIYGYIYIVPFFRYILFKNKRKSNHIIFVSDLLMDTILKNKKSFYSFDIIPCLVNDKLFLFDNNLRQEMREKYKIKSNQKVFVYSGSMVGYQSFDLHIEFYKKILSDNNNFLFILTNHIQIAKSYFHNFDNERIIIKSVNFLQVNDYYNLADFGILIRSNNLLNRVASPTKFGEYCLTGLKVIMNKNVKQCYDNALNFNNFVDVNSDFFSSLNFEQRTSIVKSSKLLYCRENYINNYITMYNNLIIN